MGIAVMVTWCWCLSTSKAHCCSLCGWKSQIRKLWNGWIYYCVHINLAIVGRVWEREVVAVATAAVCVCVCASTSTYHRRYQDSSFSDDFSLLFISSLLAFSSSFLSWISIVFVVAVAVVAGKFERRTVAHTRAARHPYPAEKIASKILMAWRVAIWKIFDNHT